MKELVLQAKVEDRDFSRWFCSETRVLFGDLDYSPLRAGFESRVWERQFGSVDVMGFSSSPLKVSHARWHVDEESERFLWIGLVGSGCGAFTRNDREVLLDVGDVVLYDNTEAYNYHLPEGMDLTFLRVPRATASTYFPQEQYRTIPKLSRTTNEGQVAGSLISMLVRNGRDLAIDSQSAFGDHVLGLLGLMVNDRSRSIAPIIQTRRTIADRIIDYINENIDDEHLAPSGIARANGISHRYLNKIFEGRGTTVQRHILNVRLELCRKALHDEAWSGRSISEIAYAYGFTNMSHFCRVFKNAYGVNARASRV